jgi:hypothetical protein
MLEQDLKRTRAEADNRERMLIKPLLLDIIDIRDPDWPRPETGRDAIAAMV